MPKSIPSPAKCWPGEVELPDALSYPQYIVWEQAVAEAAAQTRAPLTLGAASANPAVARAMLPGVCACVSAWRLGGSWPAQVTPATFPATPRQASVRLLFVLMAAISQLVEEADADLPKA